MNTAALDEEFLDFESKVNEVVKLLEDINKFNQKDEENASSSKKATENVPNEINEKDFIVTVKENRTSLNKEAGKQTDEEENKNDVPEMDKFTFMKQLEVDAEKRAENKRERERIAQNFRTLGNDAFRKQKYEKAINMYSKAIDHVRDSPILYNNRALAYIKLKNFKRAIMDCDYVLNKLEEKNLRSWLYRASAYKLYGDEKNYETSMKLARKNNPKKSDYIDDFLKKFASESI